MTSSDQKSDPELIPPAQPTSRAVNSKELLRGKREVQIQHLGEVYRLLLTRNGKLILQK